jgi:hypothetical protein
MRGTTLDKAFSAENLPNEEQLLYEIYKQATNMNVTSEARMEAFRLYAEIRGFVLLRHSSPPQKQS